MLDHRSILGHFRSKLREAKQVFLFCGCWVCSRKILVSRGSAYSALPLSTAVSAGPSLKFWGEVPGESVGLNSEAVSRKISTVTRYKNIRQIERKIHLHEYLQTSCTLLSIKIICDWLTESTFSTSWSINRLSYPFS